MFEHARQAKAAERAEAFLGYVRAVASGVMITAYCLWAFENATKTGTQAWFEISIIPFVLAILQDFWPRRSAIPLADLPGGTRLIDDLLDVTRIRRGMIQLHQEVVDAHACFWASSVRCFSFS